MTRYNTTIHDKKGTKMHFMACDLALRPSTRSQDIEMECQPRRHKKEEDF